MKLTAHTAREILDSCEIDPLTDFHALSTDQVLAITEYAKELGYRKPKNANGSRAMYFYNYVLKARKATSCNPLFKTLT